MAKGRIVIRVTSASPRVVTLEISKLTVVPWSMACSTSSQVSMRLTGVRMALVDLLPTLGAGSGASR